MCKRFIRLHTKTMRTSFSQTYTLHNYKGRIRVLYVQHNTSDRKYVYACFCCESIEFYASGAWRPKVIVVCLSQRCFDDFKLAWTELRSVKRIKTSSS